MFRNKNLLPLVTISLLILIVSITLTACAQGGNTSPPPTQSPPPATKPGSITASSPTVTPKYGGILKVITTPDPGVFGYPPQLGSANSLNYMPALETLVRFGQNTIEPFLATSWTIAPDGKSITFALRKGVKFHDGTDFNAQAVKWNLDLLKSVNWAELQLVTSIDAIDDYTVRLNLSQYSNALLWDLASFSSFMVSPTAVQTNGKEWARVHPVGTGPFKFVSYQRDTAVKYEKFTGYWDSGKPYLDGIEIDYVADQMVTAAALKSGQADMWRTTSSGGAQSASQLQNAGFNVASVPGAITALAGDSKNTSSPFADKRVREAVEYAIDRPAITKALGYGFWEPAFQLASKDVPAYNPEIQGRPYNPEMAKQLLNEAGYSKGLTTQIIAPTSGTSKDALTSIQGYLKAVGINIEISMVDQGQWVAIRSKGWNNALINWGVYYPSGNYVANLNRGLPSNYTYFPSMLRPDWYESSINNTLAATDPAVQTKLTQQLVKAMADDATFTPLWVGKILNIKQPNVNNDSLCTVNGQAWYPADTWISK